MKKGTKIIIGGGAVLLLALFLVPMLAGNLDPTKSVAGNLSGTPLAKLDLTTSVSAAGLVESVTSKKIYSTANYAVETIDVKLGDTVTAGQLLCTLDSADLESQIAQKEVSMQSSSVNTYFQLSQSEKRYNEAKNNYDNGLNVELNSAQSNLDRTKMDLETARGNLESAQKNLDTQNHDKLITAKDELKAADSALFITKRDYDEEFDKVKEGKEALTQAENGRISAKTKLSAAKSALKVAQSEGADAIEKATAAVISAQSDYDRAEVKLKNTMSGTLSWRYTDFAEAEKAYDAKNSELDAILTAIGGDVASFIKAVDSAELAYNNAAVSFESTKLSVESQLDTYKTTMENDRATMSNEPQMLELDSMKKKLKACTVSSPVNGTVTAVNVTEGAPASGALFIVEDIGALKINVTIKEYDINSVAVGMRATVTSDATGDEEFSGKVTSVAPTALKDVSNGGFKAEITLDAKDAPLLIGMSTRVNIITEEKTGVLGIRYDAVGVNADGKDFVFVAKPNGSGGYTAEEVLVTVGMKTDFEVEISSESLHEGDIVITEIEGLKSGSIVVLKK